MSKKRKTQEHEGLTEEEVAAANGEPLPEREAMTVLTPPLPVSSLPIEPLPPVYTLDPPTTDA
jgi:hypothetical protein